MTRRSAICAALAALLAGLAAPPARADFRHARPGPRPRAMGSAFVSVADDANAVYWNPAGMVQLAPRFELTGCRTMLYAVDALSNDYLAAVYDWDNRRWHADRGVRDRISVDSEAKHITVTLPGGRLVGVDPGQDALAAGRWRSFELSGDDRDDQ